MNAILKLLHEAADLSRLRDDGRNFCLGSLAIRGDGAIVKSYNGAPSLPNFQHHSEARLCRKLDRGAIVFVARTTKNGDWAMSRPCRRCMTALKRAYVKKVYYTIAPQEYGCVIF